MFKSDSATEKKEPHQIQATTSPTINPAEASVWLLIFLFYIIQNMNHPTKEKGLKFWGEKILILFLTHLMSVNNDLASFNIIKHRAALSVMFAR